MRHDATRRELYARRAEEVRERIQPSEVIGRAVTLKKHGRDFAGLCPFHNEKTPSFWVVNGKRFFHCFGCGASGDVIDFVRRHYGKTFIEALELLEAQGGLQRLATLPATGRTELDEETRRLRAERERENREEAERKLRTVHGIVGSLQVITPDGPVDRYLRGRCIVPPATYGVGDAAVNAGWPVDIGFHPSLWHPYAKTRHPAMVSLIRSPAGVLWAVHQTFLVLADRGHWIKASFAEKQWTKLVLGGYAREVPDSDRKVGGSIRLGPAAAQMTGGEGLETSLSCMQIWRRSGVCFISSNNMPNVELPFACSDFVYGADKDPKRQGEHWAWRAARLNSQARRVQVQVPRLADLKCDFNDVLQRSTAMQGEVA